MRSAASDFDFLLGQWHVSHRRLKDRLAGSHDWEIFDGTSTVQPILGGAGNIDDNVLPLPLGKHMPFSEGVVRQLHALLYRYMPQASGRWKATNNDIIERHPGDASRLRLRPVAAYLTPTAMAHLTLSYASVLDQHLADPLVLAPLALLY